MSSHLAGGGYCDSGSFRVVFVLSEVMTVVGLFAVIYNIYLVLGSGCWLELFSKRRTETVFTPG